MSEEKPAPTLPLLTLAPDVEVLPHGLCRGSAVTAVNDLLTVVALYAGVEPDEKSGLPTAAAPLFEALHRRSLLCWRVPGVAEAEPLLTGIGLPPMARISAGPGPIPLSRFALLRRSEGRWLLESGRSRWVVRLTDAGVAGLSDCRVLGDLANPFLALLGATGMLDNRDNEPVTLSWEPHDRYFASRCRSDATVAPYRLATVRPPEPAVNFKRGGEPRIALPVPTGPQPDEPSLWTATESRRTVREFADRPIALAALGALLWRTLRVVRHQPRDPDNPHSYDQIYRPVASGGAMAACDLWLLCEAVTGVPAGVWRYDPFSHELVGVETQRADVARALAFSGEAAAKPAVIGFLTVRHARASWKYSGITYALELKDVGVIMHALQLTAAAVGLGMCMWGSGPTEGVARLLGVDPEIDAPAGEFVLGLPGLSSSDKANHA